MATREQAKEALDKVIGKARIHFYKPIQIAEVLYHIRVHDDGIINPLEVGTYRTQSKRWRDDVCMLLHHRVSSSNSRYQDDLFNANAVPPILLNELNIENARTGGAVEAYIYRKFANKHEQLSESLDYCSNVAKEDFFVKEFIDSFWNEPGLKRSIDKIYEIIVYALFSTIVDALNLKVEVSVNEDTFYLLQEFEDFSKKVMSIDFSNPIHAQEGHVYRVGITNAADRGLDMYANWGPAIQIKHLSLDVSLAEDIVNSISSDRIIIVCKDAEKDMILFLLSQIGWRSHIQSIITENDLVEWYEKALRGKYAEIVGYNLMKHLCEEISREFPFLKELPVFMKERQYDAISDPFWT